MPSPGTAASSVAAWQPLSLTLSPCRSKLAQEVCIHHVFVMLRVLRLAPSNSIIWQLSLLGEPCLFVASAGEDLSLGVGSTHLFTGVLVQQPFALHSAAWRSAVNKQLQSATLCCRLGPIGADRALCTMPSQAALHVSSSQDLPPGAADRELEGLLHSAARPLVDDPAPTYCVPRGATGGTVARQALAEVRLCRRCTVVAVLTPTLLGLPK